MNHYVMVLLNGPPLRNWDPRPSVAGKRRSRQVGAQAQTAAPLEVELNEVEAEVELKVRAEPLEEAKEKEAQQPPSMQPPNAQTQRTVKSVFAVQ